MFSQAAPGAAFVTYIRAVILRDMGAAISPFAAFLLLQGTETLSLRLERHAENTKKVIEYLNHHPLVEKVNHPLLADHPDHDLYKKFFKNGGGSIFTFEIKGERSDCAEIIDQFAAVFSVGQCSGCEISGHSSGYHNTQPMHRGGTGKPGHKTKYHSFICGYREYCRYSGGLGRGICKLIRSNSIKHIEIVG